MAENKLTNGNHKTKTNSKQQNDTNNNKNNKNIKEKDKINGKVNGTNQNGHCHANTNGNHTTDKIDGVDSNGASHNGMNGNHNGTNGVIDLPVKGPEQLFSDASPKPLVRRAFENGFASDESPVVSPTPFHDELMGNIHIYTLWMRKFSRNKNNAEKEWHKFRKDAIDQYDAFEKRLNVIETEVTAPGFSDQYMDMNCILQKKENIDTIYSNKDDYDSDFQKVSKIFEQFAQYLPKEEQRKKVDSMMTNLRERYFNLLQKLNRKKEILRWIIPRLQRYKTSGSEIKVWLDSAESRTESFISTMTNMTANKDIIEQIIDEINEKKNIYEDFLAAGKEIYEVDLQMDMDELQHDIEDVVTRWDLLVSNMERCLDRIEYEKRQKEIGKASETEKIDIKVEDEAQMCTCCTPFKITRVGDGKYTFGTSKTIRLLRIHGSSIVVRVGGGWEYLYNFLLKVDPCRAKQLAATPPSKGVDTMHLSGISLTPLDEKDSSFTMSIKNIRKQSFSQPQSKRISRNNSIINTPSCDELDSCGDSFESLTLSESSSTSSVTPIEQSRNKSRSGSLSKTTQDRQIYARKFSHASDSKLYRSTDNIINRKKSEVGTPRISLMDRQSTYAKKRHSMVVHSSSVLNL